LLFQEGAGPNLGRDDYYIVLLSSSKNSRIVPEKKISVPPTAFPISSSPEILQIDDTHF
jgi:hypothetical protein